MRPVPFLLVVFLSLSHLSFTQNVYKFIGNGSWKVASNWLNNAIPPGTPASGDSIIVDPSGECMLDAVLSVSNGVKLVVRPGKKFTIANNPVADTDSTFTDPRDGQEYPYKTIGGQVWMTKNLNYEGFSSCYDNKGANCAIYGRLYNWNEALTAAPPGWHLPSAAEWNTLINYLGGENVAGAAMKSTSLWASPNTGATNSSGFSGLPGGSRNGGGGYNFDLGKNGYWWSSTEASTDNAWARDLNYNSASAISDGVDKEYWLSVRCVRDAFPEDSTFTDTRDGQKYPYKTIGTQVWMTKNFNYAAAGSWCYDDNAANCDVYGRLYDWNTAVASAPTGWHLPSDAEWTTLTNYLGGESVAGGAMKSVDLWASPNSGATNISGFSGVPGGYRNASGYYHLMGTLGKWWSTTAPNANLANNRYLYYNDATAGSANDGKDYGLSVRYIRDTVQQEGVFSDPRDGQKYPFKTFGSQVWMTTNLNYVDPASSCYDDNAANCAIYGRLYDWNTATTVAPPGWHLPSKGEWDTLINFLGGDNVAGGAIKDTVLWASPNIGATNSSGFTGLPGGSRNDSGNYNNIGAYGSWWSSTESDPNNAWYSYLSYSNAYAFRNYYLKYVRYSVRCVRD